MQTSDSHKSATEAVGPNPFAQEDEPITADALRSAVLKWATRFQTGDRWDTEDVRDLESALGGTVENVCHHRSTVPRVARSIEDLRVGQVVAWFHPGDGWATHIVMEATGAVETDADGKGKAADGFWTTDGGFINRESFTTATQQVVILQDAPLEPDYLVPRAAMERLREAQMGTWDTGKTFTERYDRLIWSTRAVLDAATEADA